MKRLRDRVAVVTGAASGIGRAVSVALAAAGCDLALVDVDRVGLEAAAEQVRAAGRRVSLHVADVSDRSRMEALPEEVIAGHGRVHVLVNNAGITAVSALESHDLGRFERVVGVNLWGVVYGCKLFLPHLLREDEGHVVNVSSLAGLVGFPGQTSYCTTKFAVRGFSEALAAELAPTRVGLTVVYPGTVRTSILRSAHFDSDSARQRLMPLLEQRGLQAERVAARIVTAIRRREAAFVIGVDAHLLRAAQQLVPALPRRLLSSLFRRVSR